MNRRCVTRAEWIWVAVVTLIVLSIAIAPYIYGVLTTPSTYHYNGLVWLPVDNSLLLSTMWEGVRGHWLHRPPYVTDADQGALFYPQYIFLGHVAGWLRLDLPLTLHVGRLLGGVVLLVSIYHFVSRFFGDVADRRFAFALAAFGSGLGWLALLVVGDATVADMHHQEVFPFFSILSSLHLTWAMGALLWLMDFVVPSPYQPSSVRAWLLFSAGALLVGATQPFGIVEVGAVGALWLVTCAWCERRLDQQTLVRLLVMGALATPFIIYQLWTIANNPAYIGWREQVQNLSPPAWDYLLAIGLLLPFLVSGISMALRRRDRNTWLPIFWVGATALLVYLPYYQNRRFEFGIWIPIAVLAAYALRDIAWFRWPARRFAFVALTALTNLILLASIFWTIDQRHPSLFITQDEWNAILYLRTHAPERAVVMASPHVSLAVLSSSSLRVVYGVPTETPHAAETLAKEIAFYTGILDADDALLRPVDYIILGPRERALGTPRIPSNFSPQFTAGIVIMYARMTLTPHSKKCYPLLR